ncbi:MAG: DNA primase [Thermogladius sp.]|nr:DNA primase [Thermogladius sp.]
MSRRDLNKQFLRRVLRLYYSRRPLVEPVSLHSREIAVVDLESEAYIRHLHFTSMAQLYSYILGEKTPLHLYYSSALYEDPSAENMSSKGWRGSELIFDIDVDHLPGCGREIGFCVEDDLAVEGGVEKCPSGQKPVSLSVIEPECFRKGVEEAFRLKEILEEDLGFREVKVYFSGNRGFHIRVSDELALDLTREARGFIADYVSCEGMDVERVFPAQTLGRARFVYLTSNERGIRARVLKRALEMGVVEELEPPGLPHPSYKRVADRERWYRIPAEYLSQLLSQVCVSVDKVVTIDTTRLSRFENSINGKAGLKVAEVRDSMREGFELREFHAWSGKIVVAPSITFTGLRVLDAKLDLKKGMRLELEAPYALYLILRKLANFIMDKGVEPLV